MKTKIIQRFIALYLIFICAITTLACLTFILSNNEISYSYLILLALALGIYFELPTMKYYALIFGIFTSSLVIMAIFQTRVMFIGFGPIVIDQPNHSQLLYFSASYIILIGLPLTTCGALGFASVNNDHA
jgi:hypothetical protein